MNRHTKGQSNKVYPQRKRGRFSFFYPPPPFSSSRKRSYTTLTFLIELKQGLKIKLSLITCHHGLQYECTEDEFIYKAIAEWTNIWLGCVEGTRGQLHIKRDIQREGEIHIEVWLLIFLHSKHVADTFHTLFFFLNEIAQLSAALYPSLSFFISSCMPVENVGQVMTLVE